MASRRKKRHSAPLRWNILVPSPVRELTEEEKQTYFADVFKTCDISSISLKSILNAALTDEEAAVKISTDVSRSFAECTDPDMPSPYFPIGQFTLTGSTSQILDLLDSTYDTKATLRWVAEGECLLCIIVHPEAASPRVVSLESSLTISPILDEATYKELCGHSKRGVVQLIANRHQLANHETCVQLVLLVNSKVFHVGGAERLPSNSIRIRQKTMSIFIKDVQSPEMLNHLPNFALSENESTGSIVSQIFQFYKWTRSHRISTQPVTPPLILDIPGLTATLLGYQTEAVKWMLSKEQAKGWKDNVESCTLHPLWQKIVMEVGQIIYYNCYTGKLSMDPFPSPLAVTGGILADEMGLGKTVEVLALILVHKWAESDTADHTERCREYVREEMEKRHDCASGGFFTAKRNTAMEDINMNANEMEIESVSNDAVEVTQSIESADTPSEEKDSNKEDIIMEDAMNSEKSENVMSNCVDSSIRHNGVAMDSNDLTSTAPQSIDTNEKEEVWCVCGACHEDDKGAELVQCDMCQVWQHSACVDYNVTRNNVFICVRCLLKKPIACGTTLIIVPESLLHQWLEEVAKHVDTEAVSVMVYKGVSRVYVNPLHIMSHDVVLVTYETLRKELDRVHFHEFSVMLRKRKVYSYPPSPLLALNWWRVCLDEAQTVESVNTKAAEMTNKLTAVNRWCVTGTPVQRDLKDLFGLVYFLGYRPWSYQRWWEELVWKPYGQGNPRPMVALFARLMWRNSKEDVADEIHLPELKEELHWLTFSPVEDYFYKKQEEMCKKDFLSVVNKMPDCSDYLLSELHRSTITRLLFIVQKLRQACCHPQLVKKGYVLMNTKKNSYLTMSDLLKKLVTQAKQEGREELRQLVFALNGQAGINILKKNFKEALVVYNRAIREWKKHADRFVCDRLQRIHTLENLAFLLREGHSYPDDPNISADSLMEQAAVLRSEYLLKPKNGVMASLYSLSVAAGVVRKAQKKTSDTQRVFLGEIPLEQTIMTAIDKMEDVNETAQELTEEGGKETTQHITEEEETAMKEKAESLKAKLSEIEHFIKQEPIKVPSQLWWSSVIAWAGQSSKDLELLSVLKTELLSSPDYFQQPSLFHFKDLTGLQLLFLSHFDKLQEQRSTILEQLSDISTLTPPSDVLMKQVSDCHLRTGKENTLLPCVFCDTENDIKTYESNLFSRYAARSAIEDNQKESSREMSICEKLLNNMLSFVKIKGGPRELCMAGNHLIQYLESLRKEFKHILSLWMTVEYRARACDELNMATSRMSLVGSTESSMSSYTSHANQLDIRNLNPKLIAFQQEAKTAQGRLLFSCRQLLYLQNLARGSDTDSNEETMSCPICTQELIAEWSVLRCGHCLCMECLKIILKRLRRRIDPPPEQTCSFPCPMCRHPVHSDDIHYVLKDTMPNTATNNDATQLTGSYSTKITGVVGTLKRIQSSDPSAKSIVFSSTFEVLKLISHALRENNIQNTIVQDKKDINTNLKVFKTSSQLNVLLLPMYTGSKGLNITEATHVLLVEPSLNIGAELQAIGRIHRVGQTKPCAVHKFYVRNTIEENIKKMVTESTAMDFCKFMTTSSTGEQDCNLTIAELQGLFR